MDCIVCNDKHFDTDSEYLLHVNLILFVVLKVVRKMCYLMFLSLSGTTDMRRFESHNKFFSLNDHFSEIPFELVNAD
jgi:hypothetical protein